jgi:hypothetical protein
MKWLDRLCTWVYKYAFAGRGFEKSTTQPTPQPLHHPSS